MEDPVDLRLHRTPPPPSTQSPQHQPSPAANLRMLCDVVLGSIQSPDSPQHYQQQQQSKTRIPVPSPHQGKPLIAPKPPTAAVASLFDGSAAMARSVSVSAATAVQHHQQQQAYMSLQSHHADGSPDLLATTLGRMAHLTVRSGDQQQQFSSLPYSVNHQVSHAAADSVDSRSNSSGSADSERNGSAIDNAKRPNYLRQTTACLNKQAKQQQQQQHQRQMRRSVSNLRVESVTGQQHQQRRPTVRKAIGGSTFNLASDVVDLGRGHHYQQQHPQRLRSASSSSRCLPSLAAATATRQRREVERATGFGDVYRVVECRSLGVQTGGDDFDNDNDGAVTTGDASFALYVRHNEAGGAASSTAASHQTVEQIKWKNRQLTVDVMRAARAVEVAKAERTDEIESMRREVDALRVRLAETEASCGHVEALAAAVGDLEAKSSAMESERDALESRLGESNARVVDLQALLEAALHRHSDLLKRNAQVVNESCEMHDFLQCEKSTLAESVKDLEAVVAQLRVNLAASEAETSAMAERVSQAVRLAEQRHQEVKTAAAELAATQDVAKAMLMTAQRDHLREMRRVARGVAAVAAVIADPVVGGDLATASKRLAAIVDEVGRRDDDNSDERQQSQLDELVLTPPVEPAEQTEEEDGHGGGELDSKDDSFGSLCRAITRRKNSEERADRVAAVLHRHNVSDLNTTFEVAESVVDNNDDAAVSIVRDLATAVLHRVTSSAVDEVYDEDVKTVDSDDGLPLAKAINATDANRATGAVQSDGEAPTTLGRGASTGKEQEEMIERFIRHRKILEANCARAEDEVDRLDKLYQETAADMLKILDSLPVDVEDAMNGDVAELRAKLAAAVVDNQESNNQTSTSTEL